MKPMLALTLAVLAAACATHKPGRISAEVAARRCGADVACCVYYSSDVSGCCARMGCHE